MVQNRHGIGISLDDEILNKIDDLRDLVSRSRFIERILAKTLEELQNE